MTTDAIFPLSVLVTGVLVLEALMRAPFRTPAVAPDGSLRLRYGWGTVGFGAMLLFTILLLVGTAAESPPRGLPETLCFIGFIVGVGLGSVYAFAGALRSVLEVSRDGVVSMSPWRSQARTLRWEEITAVRFSRILGLNLETRSGDKLWVSSCYIGYAAFLDVVLERLGPVRAAHGVERAHAHLDRMRPLGARKRSGAKRPSPS